MFKERKNDIFTRVYNYYKLPSWGAAPVKNVELPEQTLVQWPGPLDCLDYFNISRPFLRKLLTYSTEFSKCARLVNSVTV